MIVTVLGRKLFINKIINQYVCNFLVMSAKQTHRSLKQKRDDSKIAAKRARGDFIAQEELPVFDEVPNGTDNNSHYHTNNAR